MSDNPKVSVIIPTYNRLNLLTETLDSVISQTYTHWECIVVDDHSTDDTIDVVKSLSLKDSRIKLLQRKSINRGASVCRNEGIMASTGKYIIFLDSDDCLAHFCLTQRIEVMENDHTLDFAVFPCQLFQETLGDVNLLWNANTKESDIDRLLKLDVPWQTTSAIWQKQSLLNIGLWDEELLSWQDWELALRAIIQNLCYQKFDTPPDCYWRMPRNDSISSKSVSPDHLYSHESLFLKIQKMLKKKNMITTTRQKFMADLYFWLAERWLLLDIKKEALRIWNLSLTNQIITPIQYQIYKPYFIFNTSLSLKIIKRIKFLTFKIFPKKTTFRKTPLSSTISPSLNK